MGSKRYFRLDRTTPIFREVLEALIEAGLAARQSKQRLDWTQVLGLVSRRSWLEEQQSGKVNFRFE